MSFDDLVVWKRDARLSAQIYKNTNQLRDYGFRDQLTRSGLSVPSNIAEGMTRVSAKEQCRFLEIARSLLAEARTQIYIGIEIGYLSDEIAKPWLQETKEIAAMISGLMHSIMQSDK